MEIEDILSKNRDFDREYFLFFVNYCAFGYSRRDSFIRGYTKWATKMSDTLRKKIREISSISNIGHLITLDNLKKRYQKSLLALEDTMKTNKILEAEAMALKDKLEEICRDDMLGTVIEGHMKMKERYGENWDKSFLKLFTKFCYANIQIDDNRGQRYSDEFFDIISFFQTVLVRGGMTNYNFLRGPGNTKDSKSHQYAPSQFNLPIPSANMILSTIPITHVGKIFDNSSMQQLKKHLPVDYKIPYIFSFDAMYIRSALTFDENNITGIECPIPLEEFKRNPDIINDSKLYKQVYMVLAQSIDGSVCLPLFWRPFSSGMAMLQEDLPDVVDIFTSNGFEILGVCSDGDFCCKKICNVVKQKHPNVYPLSDFDHLLKTIRNNLCSNQFKSSRERSKNEIVYYLDGVPLHWKYIVDFWLEDDNLRMKPYYIFKEAIIDLQDVMSSSFMQKVFSIPLAKYLQDKSETFEVSDPQKSKEIQALSQFIDNCANYFKAFDDPNYEQYPIDVRMKTIIANTNFLIHKVKGLTSNARLGLKMNLDSLQQIYERAKQLQIVNKLRLRSLSTLCCENFFSKVRNINPNPTVKQVEKIFDKVQNELVKDFHQVDLSYNAKLRNRQVHHYSKGIQKGEATTPPLKKTIQRKSKAKKYKFRSGIKQPKKKVLSDEEYKNFVVIKSSLKNPGKLNLRNSFFKSKLNTQSKIKDLQIKPHVISTATSSNRVEKTKKVMNKPLAKVYRALKPLFVKKNFTFELLFDNSKK